METTIIGDCPIGLRPETMEDGDAPTWSAGAKVELNDFKEQVVQMDPSKGELFFDPDLINRHFGSISALISFYRFFFYPNPSTSTHHTINL